MARKSRKNMPAAETSGNLTAQAVMGLGQYYEDSYKGKDIIQPFICRLQGTFGIPVITAYGVPYWQTGYMASGEYAQNR